VELNTRLMRQRAAACHAASSFSAASAAAACSLASLAKLANCTQLCHMFATSRAADRARPVATRWRVCTAAERQATQPDRNQRCVRFLLALSTACANWCK